MNTWTMHVENFGKIKSADIETAPMTLFVGDNNSGKSYIMTLLYGLLDVDFYFEQYQFDEQSDNFAKCMKVIDQIYENADKSLKLLELTDIEIKAFEGVLNELLSINKDRFIKYLFNKCIDIGNFSLEINKHNHYVLMYVVSVTAEHIEYIHLARTNDSEGYPQIGYSCQVERKRNNDQYKQMISYIIGYMIWADFGRQPIYFPTARTGYVLTYKTLIGSALKDKFNINTVQKNLLTRPNSDFLAKLSSIPRRDLMDSEWFMINRAQSAVHIIENNIIGGQVSVSEMPSHEILYQSRGTQVQLPLFVTSGVVTEMTPLLLFFRHEITESVLIEEPEISLHPQLQCEMARVLIRLVNSEIPVFVTTHSDIILQHINNMIKLERTPNRKITGEKLGYEECDWINKDKVNVYQFDVGDDQQTTVTKLPCGEFGFEAMTFYRTLEELNRQIRIIEEE